MRIDLIPERDRFIPGWHNRPEPCRAEQFSPKWRRPERLSGVVRALLGSLREACYAIHPQHCWTARGQVTGDSVWRTAPPPGKQARWPIATYDLPLRVSNVAWTAPVRSSPQLRSARRRQEREETC